MFFQVFTSIFHYAVPWNQPSTFEQGCASSIPTASNLIKFRYFCHFLTFSQMLFTAAHLALIDFRLNSFGRFPLCFICNMNVSAKSSHGSDGAVDFMDDARIGLLMEAIDVLRRDFHEFSLPCKLRP